MLSPSASGATRLDSRLARLANAAHLPAGRQVRIKFSKSRDDIKISYLKVRNQL